MFNNKQELLAKIRLSEDSLLELKEVRLKGRRVEEPHRNSFADGLAAFANAHGGVCPLGVQDKSRNPKGAGIPRSQPNIRWRKGGGKKPFKDESRYPWLWQDDKLAAELTNDQHFPLGFWQAVRKANGDISDD